MIIHPPQITASEKSVILRAQVEFASQPGNIPDTLWFRFPAGYAKAVAERGDGLLTGLLLAAMCLGEDMEVRASVSPQLLHGVREYAHTFHTWFPWLRIPVIQADQLRRVENPAGTSMCATAFSGGVDSFYTLKMNLPGEQPLAAYQVSHCLFAQGMDLSLADSAQYNALVDIYAETLKPLGVGLIACQTNIQAFTAGRLKWDYAHGAALAAIAQVLGGSMAKLYLPSSFCFFHLVPWGSSPVIDHLLSTEALQILHHGAGVARIRKLEAISAWPPPQQALRVCTNAKKRQGVQNCSACEKCLRTMTMLKVIGKLDDFQTFKKPFPRIKILTWLPFLETDSRWAGQTIDFARQHGRRGFLPFLWAARLAGLAYDLLLKLIPRKVFLGLKRRLYPPEKNIFSQAYLQQSGAGGTPAEDQLD